MSKYRIKAYYMHEHERASAQKAADSSLIADAEWTPGYVMGVVDESSIKSLSKKGLVVSLVEKVVSTEAEAAPTVETTMAARMALPGVFALNEPLAMTPEVEKRQLPSIVENRTPRRKILSHDPKRSEFYVVRFHGPITEARRKSLRELRIKLIERLTRNKYTVRLKPSQVNTLAEVPFVDCVRLYSKEDTLYVRDASDVEPASEVAVKPDEPKTLRSSRAKRTQRTRVYSVKLHQSKDMPAVARWLAQRKHKPLWKRGDQLQVAMLENSKIVQDLANRTEVALVETFEAPRLCDENARTLLGLVRKKTEFDLKGDGEIIGIADTGIDVDHADLKKRILGVKAWGRPGDVTDPEGHGTHVAGCAVGDGSASQREILGAAPGAKLFFQSILDKNGGLGGLPNDLGDLFKEAYAKGARIHNNSWGAFNFAGYTNTSLDVDRFVAANPDMLVVIAAGNDGIGVPRASGAKMSSLPGFVDWPCVAAPATSKNGLTVGASRNSRTKGGYAELTWNDAWPDRYPDAPISKQRISSDDQSLAAFSSRGPSDDLRFKPDLVAPGTDIAAAKSKDAPLHKFWGAYPKNSQYGFMGGTSMAAPYVAGCAALVREWYRKKANWVAPSAALLKATLINGTQRIGGGDSIAPLPGEPNYHQGFGRVDMSQTVPNQLSPGLKLVFADTWNDPSQMVPKTGERLRFQVKVGNKLPLRICLVWTDPAARGLQNSLVLLVDNTKPTKWVGNAQAATILNIAGGSRDPNNNVQVVRVEKPDPGVYTIAVVGSMLLLPPQSFALVVTGDLQSALTLMP